MSALPPPDNGGLTPPPPPPDLTAPPYRPSGASNAPAIDAAAWGWRPLRRVKGLTTAIVVLLAVVALTGVIAVVATASITDEARAFVDADQALESAQTTSEQDAARAVFDAAEDDFLASYVAPVAMQLVGGVASLALLILVMIWMFRIAANHQSLHRGGTWSKGWAIGGWFLPPFLFVIPFLMLREMWKASNSDVAPGHDQWRRSPVDPLITVWFVLYCIVTPVLSIWGFLEGFDSAGFATNNVEIARTALEIGALSWISAIVTIFAAWTFAVVALRLSKRHGALIGERSGPRQGP